MKLNFHVLSRASPLCEMLIHQRVLLVKAREQRKNVTLEEREIMIALVGRGIMSGTSTDRVRKVGNIWRGIG